MMDRNEKAQKLFMAGHVDLPTGRNPAQSIEAGLSSAIVTSEDGKRKHIVSAGRCTCPDYQYRGLKQIGFACAHMLAVELALAERPDQDLLDDFDEWSWEAMGFPTIAEIIEEIDWTWTPVAGRVGRPAYHGQDPAEDDCPTSISGGLWAAWCNGREDQVIWTATT